MQITVKVESKRVQVGLQRLGVSIPRVTNDDIELSLKGARDELVRPGRHVTYPISWDSEKQRRAYFATDGFGHGIPYHRTGEYERGYKIEKSGSGTQRAYRLTNDVKYAKYVGGGGYGNSQSRIHSGRWPIAVEIVKRYAQNLVRNVRNSISQAIRNEGMGS